MSGIPLHLLPGEDAGDAPESPGRKRFFVSLLACASAGASAVLGPALTRLGIAPLLLRGGPPGAGIDVGRASDFFATSSGTSGPREVVFQERVLDGYMERVLERRLALVRDTGAASGLSALSTTCTHLGCGVGWSEERRVFLCPCHGGVYAEDGTVLSGPPPRPLERLAVYVDGGRLRVLSEKAKLT